MKRPIYTSSIAFLGLFIIGTSFGILTQRKSSDNTNNIFSSELDKQENAKTKLNVSSNISNKKEILDTNKFIPISSIAPSEKEIKLLIELWLKGKADILNGLESEILISVARPSLFNRVIDQRKKDNLLGQRQIIDASIIAINIVERSKNRIAADVDLNYKDKSISSSGEILSETVIPSLKVKYIIGKNKNNWQVVDYISGN